MNRKQLAVVTAVVAAVVAVVAVVGVVTKTIPTFCDTLVVEGVFTFTALLCLLVSLLFLPKGMNINSHGYVYSTYIRTNEIFKGV